MIKAISIAILVLSLCSAAFTQASVPKPVSKPHLEEMLKKANDLQDAGKVEEAIAAYKDVLKADPKDAETIATIAGCYARLSKPVEALEWSKKAVEMDPKLYGARINYGNALFMVNKFVEAEAEFRKAMEIDPRDAMGFYGLGTTLKSTKRYTEALPYFLTAVKKDPTNLLPAYSAAEVYYRLNQIDKSIEMLEKTITIDPAFTDAKQMLEFLKKEKAKTP